MDIGSVIAWRAVVLGAGYMLAALRRRSLERIPVGAARIVDAVYQGRSYRNKDAGLKCPANNALFGAKPEADAIATG
jgi:hypothetical protein